MFNSLCSNRGISLIEVLISLFLVSIGILALISLQPSAWKLTARSDFLGRAGGILHKEMATTEVLIMNPNFLNPLALIGEKNVNASGQSPAQPAGDIPFTVQTTIQDNLNNSWLVRVRVTWPGNNTGISESLLVTRQENFRS